MTAPLQEPDESDKLVHGVRLRSRRQLQAQREGEPSVARRLGQIGVLGWIIVVPTLLGAFGGHWLDRHFGTGVFYTGPLLMLGVGVGCWSGWKWMHNS